MRARACLLVATHYGRAHAQPLRTCCLMCLLTGEPYVTTVDARSASVDSRRVRIIYAHIPRPIEGT